jgi:hypothetical protein
MLKKTENKFIKIFFASAMALAVSVFFAAGSVSAAASINSVKLNGANNISVGPGSAVTAVINVTLTNSSVWRSTAYRVGNGNWICVDTPDHSANTTASETFLINAPSKQGSKNVNFEIYGNNDCTNGLDIASASASLSTVVMNILSVGTGKIWLSVILLALIIIVVVFVIFSIVKKTSVKNKNYSRLNDKK